MLWKAFREDIRIKDYRCYWLVIFRVIGVDGGIYRIFVITSDRDWPIVCGNGMTFISAGNRDHVDIAPIRMNSSCGPYAALQFNLIQFFIIVSHVQFFFKKINSMFFQQLCNFILP